MITIKEILFLLFVNRDDCYALQQNKGYIAKKESVTLELINQHLLGVLTLGLYQLLKNMVKWGCLDFDKDTWEDFENAKLLFNYLVKQGFNPLFEMSGGGKYRCHIWIFSDTTAAKMQEFLKIACNKTGIYPHEIFPKQNMLWIDVHFIFRSMNFHAKFNQLELLLGWIFRTLAISINIVNIFQIWTARPKTLQMAKIFLTVIKKNSLIFGWINLWQISLQVI